MKKKRSAALLLSGALALGTLLTGFTYQDGFGNAYFDSNQQIGPSTSYKEQIGVYPGVGNEHAYLSTANFSGGVVKPYVFEGEVTGKYTLDSMISQVEKEGYRVLAGINGDLFDTKSGTPKGLVIHNGKIKTSGYAPEYDIVFDQGGNASLAYANLTYSMTGTIQDMVTPPPASDTPAPPADSSNPPPGIVPSDGSSTSPDGTSPDNGNGGTSSDQGNEGVAQNNGGTPSNQKGAPSSDNSGAIPSGSGNGGTASDNSNGGAPSDNTRATTDSGDNNGGTNPSDAGNPGPVYQQQDVTLPIGFINVPHGGAKALHLFNRQYAASTKTSPNCVEVVLEPQAGSGPEPYVGGTLTATVVSAKINTSNTPIGDNQMVLSAQADSPYAATIAKLVPGSTVSISVSGGDGSALANAQEAIGVYQVLVQDNQLKVTSNSRAPRTSIGIKADGSVIIYAVDGRQSSISQGLGLADVAKHMMALGCVTVVNMDGGGSTMFAARSPGIDVTPKLKNSPSDKTQRKVTNGLLFVYSGQGSGNAAQINLYPALSTALPGADVTFTPYASDELFEPATLPDQVTYQVSENDAFTGNGNTVTMGAGLGVQTVTAQSGGISGTAEVNVVNDVQFTPSVTSLTLDPGASKDINITSVMYGNVPVLSKDSLFTWACDPSLGTITPDGVFTAANGNGLTGNITVTYNGAVKTIPVQVGQKLSFTDIQGHWAQTYIEDLASKGIINGMGNGLFAPDASVSRAQFLTMLAQSAGADVSSAPSAGFEDVSAKDWYYSYVNWGFANGVVKGIDQTHFSPNEKITREQMAVMLQNYLTLTNRIPTSPTAAATFKDHSAISQWAQDAVEKMVSAGILSGRPDGTFDPQGSATRAEAATVLYMTQNKTQVSAAPVTQTTGPAVSAPNTTGPAVNTTGPAVNNTAPANTTGPAVNGNTPDTGAPSDADVD